MACLPAPVDDLIAEFGPHLEYAPPGGFAARGVPDRGDGAVAMAVVTGFVAAGVLFFVERSNEFYRRKDFAVGEGADRVVSYSPYTS